MVSVKSLTLSSSHYFSSLSVEPRSSLTYSQSIRLNRLRRVSVTDAIGQGSLSCRRCDLTLQVSQFSYDCGLFAVTDCHRRRSSLDHRIASFASEPAACFSGRVARVEI